MPPVQPLTVFAHCPRCGSSRGGAVSIKQYVCRHCGFEYFQNAAAAVIGVIRRPDDDKVLFVRREKDPAKGKLDLPGGFVDPLEPAEVALRREVREEVGLEVTDAQFLCSFPNRYDYAGVTYYSVDLAFACSVADLSALRALDEVSAVEFHDPAGLDPAEIGFTSIRSVMGVLTRA